MIIDPDSGGRQGEGIGAALVRAGIAELAAAGAAGFVVLGDPAYYARFGFASDARLTYAGSASPYLQYLALSGEPPRGDARYHAAFS